MYFEICFTQFNLFLTHLSSEFRIIEFVLYLTETEIILFPIAEAPGPPRKLKVSDIGIDSLTLSWAPPESDGGDQVTGYLVEKLELPRGHWVRASSFPVRQTSLKVSDLKSGGQYQFRVIARNKVGNSLPCEPSDAVTMKETPAAVAAKEKAKERERVAEEVIETEKSRPKERRPSYMPKTAKDIVPPEVVFMGDDVYNLRPGQNLRVPLKVTSSVRTDVDLVKNGVILHDRVIVEKYGDDVFVSLRRVVPEDASGYQISVSNSAGERKLPFRLNVSDVPGPPKGPMEVKPVDGGFAVAWQPPENDGGEPITHYILEKKDVRRPHWARPVRLGPKSLSKALDDLAPGMEYAFRVAAENAVGQGPFLMAPETYMVKKLYGKILYLKLEEDI